MASMQQEYTQGELELTLPKAMDQWWVPRHPIACDHFTDQVEYTRAEALTHRYIAPNSPRMCGMLVCDIDSSFAKATALWNHQGFEPNILTTNPKNGHAHAIWALNTPVCTTELGSLKAIALAQAVLEGLRRSVDGDIGYAGHLTKNPMSPVWEAELICRRAYDLQYLKSVLTESGDMPPRGWRRTKRAQTAGLGRNCTIFEQARREAYREVRRLPDRSDESLDALEDFIYTTCFFINDSTFPAPLRRSEVRCIAKSIFKWITTQSRIWRDGAAAMNAQFITIQSYRGMKLADKKTKIMEEKFEQFKQSLI